MNPMYHLTVYLRDHLTLSVFPTSPLQRKQKGPGKDKTEDLPPVKEADIPQSNKDPKNFSGCIVS